MFLIQPHSDKAPRAAAKHCLRLGCHDSVYHSFQASNVLVVWHSNLLTHILLITIVLNRRLADVANGVNKCCYTHVMATGLHCSLQRVNQTSNPVTGESHHTA